MSNGRLGFLFLVVIFNSEKCPTAAIIYFKPSSADKFIMKTKHEQHHIMYIQVQSSTIQQIKDDEL